MSVLEWQEPPGGDKLRYRSRYDRIAEELRERPNEWALVRRGATGTSNGTYAKKRLGPDFQVVTRAVDGATDVYARYVGGATR